MSGNLDHPLPNATGERMKFLYMGFAHKTTGIREYIFQGLVAGGVRKGLLVTTDVALLTKHHIQIQEVPMMCLRLLESTGETDPQLDLILTETDMLAHIRAKELAKEQAALSKKTRRSVDPENLEPLDAAPRS